jgi:2-amino-4-hydroxy-6-hydroxymethyldihydropteridine diphosphokinase
VSPLVRAYLGIGSNLGARQKNCERACQLLADVVEITIIAMSSWREYPALTLDADEIQPAYCNGVIAIETTLSPNALLAHCHTIESTVGRERPPQKWAPRLIDIDLLDYAGLVRPAPQSGGLTLPHPELHRRPFVLEPLQEIAPRWRHPTFGKTATQLLEHISSTEAVPVVREMSRSA